MFQQFLLHLPDGTQYGPIDRATLEDWRREGRLPDDTLVWPEGAPEWISLASALEAAPQSPAAPAAAPAPARTLDPSLPRAPAPPTHSGAVPAAKPKPGPAAPRSARPTAPAAPARDDDPQTRPSMRMAAFDGKASTGAAPTRGLGAITPGNRRRLALASVGLLLLVVLVAGMLALLRPLLARRQAIAEVRRYALAERRIEDPGSGLAVELPAGWLALRSENPYVVRPGTLLALAQPAAGVYGAVSLAVRPAMMDDLDAHLSELLQQRLSRQPSEREGERRDVQLGRGRGRLVRTSWEDDLARMQGATVAWADGYNLFSLEAWAAATTGEGFVAELETICRGLTPAGLVAARVDEAVERLTVEVPELSRPALRLLVAGRMSQDRGLGDVPSDALRAVSRGLDALDVAQASEMRAIYQQVWAPVPEEERVRLAGLLNEVKAGRPVAAADAQALRDAVRAGVLTLPETERARLQELSELAVRKSLLLP